MNRRRMCVVMSVAVLLVVGAGALAGGEKDARLELKRVSLFKNGIGYFSSKAKLPDDATTVNLGQLPVPSLGTFWVYYPRDVKVTGLFTSLVETEKEVPASNILEILQLNAGATVEILTSIEGMKTIKGTVIASGEPEERPEPPNPYVMGPRVDPQNRWRHNPYAPFNASTLLLKTDDGGLVALNAGSILGARNLDEKATLKKKRTKKQAAVRLELGEAAGGTEISVNYLARGVTWVPSYQIDVSDPAKARLSAKALVVNEVADLKGVTIELVTGFPHIKFADVNSPVAMTQDLAGFLKALASGRSEGGRGDSYMGQQRAMPNYATYAREEAAIADYSTARKGTTAEDLFFYPIDSINLAKGETAYVPLFTAELDYHHIYTWKIADVLDEQERYNRNRNDQRPSVEEIWHSCRIKNSMDMPWTTAAAEFVKDGQFIGQDVCHYTAPGTETTVRITRAMNLVAEQNEFEISRERNNKQFHGYRYDLVTLEGELRCSTRPARR